MRTISGLSSWWASSLVDTTLMRELSWFKLDRIRSGFDMSLDTIFKFGLTDNPTCNCNAGTQTVNHLINYPLIPGQA